jgi:prepilin-type N-terminal cleavage/methylation domain-containing protein
MSNCQATRPRAFSLLELLIVLAVMAGVSALVFPSLARPLAENEVQRAAAALRDEISQCRNRAVLGNQMLLIRFLAGEEQIQSGTWQSLMADSNGLLNDSGQSSSLKSFRLPVGIVVERVEWSDQTNSLDSETLAPVSRDSADLSVERDATSIDSEVSGDVWYLSYLPTGRCRDCHIILRDTSTGARCGLEIDGVLQMMRFQRLPSITPSESSSVGQMRSGRYASGAPQ